MPGMTSQGFPYPLYTEANNGPAQIQALATAINTSVSASQTVIGRARNRKSGSVTAAGAQAIPNAVYTTVTYTTEEFDSDNLFNLGVSNTTATIVTAGIYLAMVTVRFAANATGSRGVRFQRGGVTDEASVWETLTVAGGLTTTISTVQQFSLGVGNTLTTQVLQGSGGALNIDARRFELVRLSGL